MEFKQFKTQDDKQFTPEKKVTTDFNSSATSLNTSKDFKIKELFQFNSTESRLLAGQKVLRTGVGTTYSTAASDFLIGVTSLVNAPTIGLPRPKLVGAGKIYNIKDEVGGAATTTITVVSQGEETIDGSASFAISTNYAAITFYTDGANWFIY